MLRGMERVARPQAHPTRVLTNIHEARAQTAQTDPLRYEAN